MRTNILAVALVATIVSNASASEPVAAVSATAKKIEVSTKIVESRYTSGWREESLQVVTKNGVAGTNAAMVAGALLGFGLPGVTGKKGFRGRAEENVASPIKFLLANYAKAIEEYAEQNPQLVPSSGKIELETALFDFDLVYKAMTETDTPYILNYTDHVSVNIIPAAAKKGFMGFGKSKTPSIGGIECKSEPESRRLEEWTANDWRIANESVKKIIERCTQEFKQKLPDMMALVPTMDPAVK